MAVEIEKKFLLTALPKGIQGGLEIMQGYLSVDDPEVRIRSRGKKYFATLKSGEGFIREEEETEISRETFEILWPATKVARVTKTRYKVEGDDGLVWEVDKYKGKLKGLVIAEVELPFAEAGFVIPEDISKVLGNDVTKDKGYKNKNLAMYGIP